MKLLSLAYTLLFNQNSFSSIYLLSPAHGGGTEYVLVDKENVLSDFLELLN